MLTEHPTVEVRLPLTLDSLVAAESQVDVFVDQLLTGRDETLAFALRVIVNEGFRNALNAQPLEGRLKVVRLRLRGCPDGVRVTIAEPGRGVPVQGVSPPYPASLIGKDIRFASVVAQDLVAHVVTPTRLDFRAELSPSDRHVTREEILELDDDPKALGILTLCRECAQVSMIYDSVEGNVLSAFYPFDLEAERIVAG